MPDSKVLITGASGFIGWHLAQALIARGDEVACLVRKTSNVDRLRPLGVRLVYGDVTDPASLAPAVAAANVVYHVAGCIMALRRRQYDEVNHQGTRNLLAACAAQTTPPVLVAVSSMAAVGPAVDGRPRTETDHPVQVSSYGRSKRAAELAAREFADRVPVTIVRPAMVMGEGDPVGIQLFRPIARFGIHVVRCRGRERQSVIHAADLAQLLIASAERGVRLKPDEEGPAAPIAGCYFSDCDEHPSYAELGRMVAVALGRRRVLVMPTPPRTLGGIAAFNLVISQIRRRPMYINFDRLGELTAGSWLGSTEAARQQLGFSVDVSLAERLRQTAEWYRQEGWV
ncbi:MAG: NAD(P)-dependent oxidoreductase [Candidatus Nealsonbacteria bacterium]|nr:NAD(P)-dependent oxidoreductase [Candidatus Nealsonbacteria bacterium]